MKKTQFNVPCKKTINEVRESLNEEIDFDFKRNYIYAVDSKIEYIEYTLHKNNIKYKIAEGYKEYFYYYDEKSDVIGILHAEEDPFEEKLFPEQKEELEKRASKIELIKFKNILVLSNLTSEGQVVINTLKDCIDNGDDFFYSRIEEYDFTRDVSLFCKKNNLAVKKLYRDAERQIKFYGERKWKTEIIKEEDGYLILPKGEEYFEMYKMMNY